MKNLIFALVLTILLSAKAEAGFMDKLNSATQKLNEKSQQIQQGNWKSNKEEAAGEDEDRPLKLKGQGHCKGQNSATCMDYMEVVDQCTAPLKTYRAERTVVLIEKKLQTEELTDQQRANLEEDLEAFKEAIKNNSDSPTIAGQKNSQRYLMDISQDDQVTINSEYGVFYQKIMNKCMGADHMGTGHRTEMNYVKDNSKEMAERKKQENVMVDLQACMAKTQGLRMSITADILEKKMATQNLSAAQQAEWQEDIALVREAAEKNQYMPQTADPMKSMRYAQKLSLDEQMAVNQEFGTQSQKLIADCSATADANGKSKPKDMSKSSGPVDHSKSPANPIAQKINTKKKSKDGKWHVQQNRGALSCYLGACVLDGLTDITECQKQTSGYWWKVLADGLQEKLDNGQGLTDLQKEQIQEDIDVLREADAQRLPKPRAVDPENTMRYQDHFTKKEFGECQLKYQKMYKTQMDYCNTEFGDILKHN